MNIKKRSEIVVKGEIQSKRSVHSLPILADNARKIDFSGNNARAKRGRCIRGLSVCCQFFIRNRRCAKLQLAPLAILIILESGF